MELKKIGNEYFQNGQKIGKTKYYELKREENNSTDSSQVSAKSSSVRTDEKKSPTQKKVKDDTEKNNIILKWALSAFEDDIKLAHKSDIYNKRYGNKTTSATKKRLKELKCTKEELKQAIHFDLKKLKDMLAET